MTGDRENIYTCSECGFKFSDREVSRTCGNCFACTGCEIYLCPVCESEVVIKPIRPMKREG